MYNVDSAIPTDRWLQLVTIENKVYSVHANYQSCKRKYFYI